MSGQPEKKRLAMGRIKFRKMALMLCPCAAGLEQLWGSYGKGMGWWWCGPERAAMGSCGWVAADLRLNII